MTTFFAVGTGAIAAPVLAYFFGWLNGAKSDRQFGEAVGFGLLAGMFLVLGVVFGPALLGLLRVAVWVVFA